MRKLAGFAYSLPLFLVALPAGRAGDVRVTEDEAGITISTPHLEAVIRGKDFVAVTVAHRYSTAAPGKRAGSLWRQTLVFPAGKRYFLSCDRVTTVNRSDALFLRLDMPGHIRHNRGDTFSEVYLSYH